MTEGSNMIDREGLIRVIQENRTWAKRMADGYMSVGENPSEMIADAVLAWLDKKNR